MKSEIEDHLIGLEKAALARWAQGDPDGFLELSAPGVTYFDPFLERRIEGREALAALYEQFRGKFRLDGLEMLDPRVQGAGDVAVLTFNFRSRGSDGERMWNTTEVYKREPAGEWRIIHTHWSLTRQGSA